MKFEVCLPTKIIFGPGVLKRIGEESRKVGKRPLVVTGKKAMQETGILDRVLSSLKKSQCDPVVFNKIEPNPRVKTVDQGARLARENGCDLIIGLGGGSAMDAAKAIALAALGEASIWSYIAYWKDFYQPAREALPIALIPTIAATGSEADTVSVITNWETHEKAVLFGDCLLPVFSIVDPELTFFVSPETTADGGIDIICHVLEPYFASKSVSPISDRFTEGIVLTVMENLKKAMDHGKDLEARSHLSWASTLALSGFTSAGLSGGFVIHPIEHALSGHYDISHGKGLAILLPAVMEYTIPIHGERYAQLAERVFQVRDADLSEEDKARRCVQEMIAFLQSVSLYCRLSDLGIDDSKFEEMAEDTIRIYGGGRGYLDNPRKLYKEDIVKIFEMC
jgi:alcohol dehydrogenase YqhD (iron-dependent ADH family)